MEDPLSYLLCSNIVEFPRNRVIFSQGQQSTSLFLVIAGNATVCRARETGRSELLLDIYQADEFFGESALIGEPHAETALALEDTKVMATSRDNRLLNNILQLTNIAGPAVSGGPGQSWRSKHFKRQSLRPTDPFQRNGPQVREYPRYVREGPGAVSARRSGDRTSPPGSVPVR
jgi:hypothetical protein